MSLTLQETSLDPLLFWKPDHSVAEAVDAGPLLLDRAHGVKMLESRAIVRHLEERYGAHPRTGGAAGAPRSSS